MSITIRRFLSFWTFHSGQFSHYHELFGMCTCWSILRLVCTCKNWSSGRLIFSCSETEVLYKKRHTVLWSATGLGSPNSKLKKGILFVFVDGLSSLRFVSFALLRGGSTGGCTGCAPPPPEMTCGFLIQLVFCKRKKNYVVYWCWSRATDECTPS